MGLAVFDCEICGRSPYLEKGKDTRINIYVNSKRYFVCKNCAKRFENPSSRKKETSVSMSQEVFEQIIKERRKETIKHLDKKWGKWGEWTETKGERK